MATDHTPGPWEIETYRDGTKFVCAPKRAFRIAKILGSTAFSAIRESEPAHVRVQRANMNLIAAAPDLLEVAKATEEWLQSLNLITPVDHPRRVGIAEFAVKLQAAIAKAEGAISKNKS